MTPKTPPDPAADAARSAGKVLFIVTEDWFFASHFLPMAGAVVEMGMEPIVITRVRDHAATIASTGARIVPFEAERRSLNPLAALGGTAQLLRLLREERPDIVHCIALKPVLIGGTAAALAGIDRRVFALTGLGFLGARRDLAGRLARAAVRYAIRGALAGRRTQFLFENADDPARLGLQPAGANVTLIGGAGIDPQALPALPVPDADDLRVAIVARMLWSKGIDVAVEAATRARAAGVPLSLSLFGAPDPSNPRSIDEARLREWSRRDGITWHGPTRDVATVWAGHHLACLPSRGGEGLPRTLLEAAACGRAIVTTDVPGCRSFVRHGQDGLIVPPDDPQALADAFVALARDRERVRAMGRNARTRVLDGFTERAVMDVLKSLYRRMLTP